MNPEKVVTRFAPSPTGNLNIGGVRAGIFAYLFTRHKKGVFVLRIEDTDIARSKKEYEENIIEALAWMGMEYDTLYRQSDNTALYEKYLRELVEKDLAYVSKEVPMEEGGREEVIRLRNQNKQVTFNDLVHGSITFDTTELKDFVIAKSFTEPVFHFANVVDDWDEGITHVVRGDDHISNTPRHILIQEALRATTPVYAHLPLILAPDKSKLSKRKGAKAITEYRDEGYLAEAIMNFDTFLGWHPEGEEEIFSKAELIEQFSLDRVQKSPAIFNEEKLLWFNHEHIKRLSNEEFAERLKDFSGAKVDVRLIPLLKERFHTLKEAIDSLKTEFDFLESSPTYEKELLLHGAKEGAEMVLGNLTKIIEILSTLADESFTEAGVKEAVFPYATEVGRAGVLWPMRVALSGKEKSPDPFTLAGLLGKQETLLRLSKALSVIK